MASKTVTAKLTFRLECHIAGAPIVVGIWYNHETNDEEALYTWSPIDGFATEPEDQQVADELSRLCVLFLAELLSGN